MHNSNIMKSAVFFRRSLATRLHQSSALGVAHYDSRGVASVFACSLSSYPQHGYQKTNLRSSSAAGQHNNIAWFMAASSIIAAVSGAKISTSDRSNLTCQCESIKNDDSSVHWDAFMRKSTHPGDDDDDDDDDDEDQEETTHDEHEEDIANEDDLPIYTAAQVAMNNGKGTNSRVWMTYGGNVYDVTDFISNHPGGNQLILQAAGGPIEPHWHVYRQHFASDLPQKYMEKMRIGTLDPADQEIVDNMMEMKSENEKDPYDDEPSRSPLLIVHGSTPMNAEVPAVILTDKYITPVSEFYIRHHHPVPLLSEEQIENYQLDVDLSLLTKQKNKIAKLSLAQIKSLPKVEVTSTLQCSGNRRSGFNDLRKTSGTPWSQGAISTAKWGGARLTDVLLLASKNLQADDDGGSIPPFAGKGPKYAQLLLQNLQELVDTCPNLQHIRFECLDGMSSSVDVSKALSPFGDVILAYEMNDEVLNREHGYPLRIIVPGYAAVRSPKWVSKLELAEDQSEGMWHRGLNYKILPPSVTDVNEVNLDQMPGLSEVSVFSGITKVSRVVEEDEAGSNDAGKTMTPGDTVLVKASGWAWAGGGRNIVRVDLTGNNGTSWARTNITHGSDQPLGKGWAWVFWECPSIPATVCEDGISVELSCKGVDLAFNTQPESSDGMWNVRGLGNNSWFRLRHKVM